jgi:hypothetical protein
MAKLPRIAGGGGSGRDVGVQLGRGGGRLRGFGRAGEAGYAAVDALVALMIFASTLVCAVSATHGSRMAADAALDFRKANELSAYLLETSPATPGETSGETDGFAWTRTVMQPVDTFGPGAICEHRVALTALRDKHKFSAKTNAVCPAELEA